MVDSSGKAFNCPKSDQHQIFPINGFSETHSPREIRTQPHKMNSIAACFNYFSPAQCVLSPFRPALNARLSRFSLDCVFSINQTGDRIFMGESSQRKILVLPVSRGAYRKLTHKESLNLVPRVLSYPSLRHSVGTGRRKPWQ